MASFQQALEAFNTNNLPSPAASGMISGHSSWLDNMKGSDRHTYKSDLRTPTAFINNILSGKPTSSSTSLQSKQNANTARHTDYPSQHSPTSFYFRSKSLDKLKNFMSGGASVPTTEVDPNEKPNTHGKQMDAMIQKYDLDPRGIPTLHGMRALNTFFPGTSIKTALAAPPAQGQQTMIYTTDSGQQIQVSSVSESQCIADCEAALGRGAAQAKEQELRDQQAAPAQAADPNAGKMAGAASKVTGGLKSAWGSAKGSAAVFFFVRYSS